MACVSLVAGLHRRMARAPRRLSSSRARPPPPPPRPLPRPLPPSSVCCLRSPSRCRSSWWTHTAAPLLRVRCVVSLGVNVCLCVFASDGLLTSGQGPLPSQPANQSTKQLANQLANQTINVTPFPAVFHLAVASIYKVTLSVRALPPPSAAVWSAAGSINSSSNNTPSATAAQATPGTAAWLDSICAPQLGKLQPAVADTGGAWWWCDPDFANLDVGRSQSLTAVMEAGAAEWPRVLLRGWPGDYLLVLRAAGPLQVRACALVCVCVCICVCVCVCVCVYTGRRDAVIAVIRG